MVWDVPRAARNGDAVPLDGIPVLDVGPFRRAVLDAVQGGRIAALFGSPAGEGAIRVDAVVARDGVGLGLVATLVRDRYESLTRDCPQAQAFERDLHERWGVVPAGHPWLKPLRLPARVPGPAGADAGSDGGRFFAVDGTAVHEVAVGPVHAGVIEPGHFRFQCAGERVLHLEIALGYQHRGVERALVGGPDRRTIHYVETAAGDASVGHAWAYCLIVEALAGLGVEPASDRVRGIALELERLANHAGDLGALSGDIGFLPAASYCGRLRGEFLNLTLLVCGSRLGRGWLRPGGVAFDAAAHRAVILDRLRGALRDLRGAVDLLRKTSTVRARMEETATLDGSAAALGVVGVAARASGLARDVRADHAWGPYASRPIAVSVSRAGDVSAPAQVRWEEIERSASWIEEVLDVRMDAVPRAVAGPLAPSTAAVALVEGWRGEILHAAHTGPDGRFRVYSIVDPSLHNWPGLALAMRGEAISDFPLANKSFNLSYCGHDL